MSRVACQFVPSLFFLMVLTMLVTVPAYASSIQTLISENSLSVDMRLMSTGPIIANQPVLFEVEVATKRWFSKGTFLVYPSVKDAVMLPAGRFGINGTKKINGATWVTQTREITLYATLPGAYVLPPVEVQVSVDTESDGVVQGSFYTKPLSFTVVVPEALKRYEAYIVSSDVQLDIRLEAGDGAVVGSADRQSHGRRAEDNTYSVGEAIRQTVTLSATNVPAMLLPPLIVPDLKGLSIYHKPALLNDISSRGELTGTRVESFTYIFEQVGEYIVPEQIFYWWNDKTQELTELTIPARNWHVSGVSLGGDGAAKQRLSFLPTIRQLGIVVLTFTGCLLIGLAYRYRLKFVAGYMRLTKSDVRTQRKAFLKAIERKQYALACELLYQLVNSSMDRLCSLHAHYASEPISLAVLERLLEAAYGNADSNIPIELGDAHPLLRKTALNKQFLSVGELAGVLQLNPKN
jgi:hypothetical protein